MRQVPVQAPVPARALVVAAVAVAAVAGLAGCLTPGRHGVLAFGYTSEDALLVASMDAAIAAGEEIDVIVDVTGSRASSQPIVVTAATSADPAVVEVIRFEGARIRVRGRSAGGADLRVTTARGTDLIHVEVAEFGHAELGHWAWYEGSGLDAGKTVLLAGGTVHFTFARRSKSGRPLVGYGIGGFVALEPPGGGSLLGAPADDQHVRVSVGAGPSLTIRPRAGTGLSFDVVGVERITSVELRASLFGDGPLEAALPVGDSRVVEVAVLLEDGRRVLALDGLLEVVSRTPAVCQVAPMQQIAGDGVYNVGALTAGDCEIVARTVAQSAILRLRTVPRPEPPAPVSEAAAPAPR